MLYVRFVIATFALSRILPIPLKTRPPIERSIKAWPRLADANRVFLTFQGLYSNVNTICFLPKNVVYLYSEEERARRQKAFSSFLAHIGRCFFFEIEKFLVASEIFSVQLVRAAALSRIIFGPWNYKKTAQPTTPVGRVRQKKPSTIWSHIRKCL